MLVLQWDDQYYSLGDSAGAQTDLDMYLVGFSGSTLFGFNRNNIGADPLEMLPFTVTEDTEAELLVVRANGTGTPYFKFIIFRGDGTIENNTGNASTIVGHANAEGAIAVGAILYDSIPAYVTEYPAVASFSSRGGTQVRASSTAPFTTRLKPEIVAPNGVNTTVDFGSTNIDGDSYYNFFGTSASAPHAAGVAALLIEGKKRFLLQDSVSPDEVKELLIASAKDIQDNGYDIASGYGMIQTAGALRVFANPAPSITAVYATDSTSPGTRLDLPAVSQGFNLLVEGELFSDSTKIIFNDSVLQTNYIDENRVWARIDSFSGNPSIHLNTEARSVSGADGGSSDTVTLYGVRKIITITPDNQRRKYGQNNPEFTASVYVDGVPIDSTEYTRTQLGLDRITFSTTADAASGVYVYPITATISMDPVTDSALVADFAYQVTGTGALTVARLPVKITPQDKTITYGDDLGVVSYTYEFDQTNIANPTVLLDSIKAQHQRYVADNVLGVIQGMNQPLTNGSVLSPTDIDSMSTMVSYQSVKNARRFTVTEDKLIPMAATDSATTLGQERMMVDVSADAVYRFLQAPAAVTLDSAYTGMHMRGLVSARKLAAGTATATYNGETVPMTNGVIMAMVNGQLMSVINGQIMVRVNGTLLEADSISVQNGVIMAMVNGQFIAVANGDLFAIVNGTTIAIDTTSITVVNGVIMAMVNGVIMAMVNGVIMAMVNGDIAPLVNGVIMAMVNGETIPLTNGVIMAMVNGELVEVEGLTVVNGQLMAEINGVIMAMVNGQVMTIVNGQLLSITNGQLLATVNGEVQVVTDVSYVNGVIMAMVNGQWTALTNGVIMAMVNDQVVTLDNISVQNGVIMAMVNGVIMAMVNGQVMSLTNGVIMAMVNGDNYGGTSSNTSSAVIIDEADLSVQGGALGAMMAVNTITGLNAGTQKLIPGTFIDDHFDVSYGLGTVEILPATITVTADDKSWTQGDSSLTLTMAVSGMAFSENITSVTMPAISTVDPALQSAGTYPIQLSGGSAANYTFVLVPGTLTVHSLVRTPVTIAADLAVVNQGATLPVFTSTITGLNANDSITGIVYSAAGVNTAFPGVYTNTPGITTTAYPQYIVSYVPGKFYVNAYGPYARKIIVKRECVSMLASPVNGFRYRAVFSYTNSNATPLYIPAGADNRITIQNGGTHDNQLPVEFLPGTHQFSVYFNGSPMVWSLRSNGSVHNTAQTSSNNAAQGCMDASMTMSRPGEQTETGVLTQEKQLPEGVYPNPVYNRLRVSLGDNWIAGTRLQVMNATGNSYDFGAAALVNGSTVDLDVSRLPKGTYLVRVPSKNGFKVFRFMKL
jgi:hypothetical protein